MVNLHVKNRARWTGKFVALAAAALLVAPVALAQDATPTAGGAEGDAMVRSMDPSALPEDFEIPGSATHITNYGVHEWYQNLTKGEAARAEEYGIFNDQGALQFARRFAHNAPVEIWEEQRLVGRVEPAQPALTD